MIRPPAHSLILPLLCLSFAIGGCETPDTNRAEAPENADPTLAGLNLDDAWLLEAEQIAEQERALDLGQDWADVEIAGSVRPAASTHAPRTSAALPSPEVGEAPPEPPQDQWVIILGTFTQDDHRQAAESMIAELRRIKPEVTDLRVHTTQKGSMVCYGGFADPKSTEAQTARTWLKSMTHNNRPVFARTMISRIKSDALPRSPYALMSVRKTYPTITPLYTLQLAAWSDFESGRMSLEEIRAKAEQQVQKLRAQGYPAFFHHDDYQRLSIVTIGLWNDSALDPATGFVDPEIEQLREKFPVHLYNGEEVRLPVDKNRPDGKTYAQPPFLVEVPKL